MILTEDKTFASESGHWYRPDGTPAYTIARSDGKGLRSTTLRDARKLGLVPSVSGIIQCMAMPGLEIYKRKSLALAMATLPKLEGESWDDFIKRAEIDAQEHGKDSREKGEHIHAAIEQHLRGYWISSSTWTPWVIEAIGELDKHCGQQHWEPEKSFADPVLGYGGKRDLMSDSWLVDIKTKDGDLKGDVFDEHVMQLSAYAHPITPRPRCGILFVRRDKPEAKLVEVGEDALDKGWRMFEALLAFWKAKNGL